MKRLASLMLLALALLLAGTQAAAESADASADAPKDATSAATVGLALGSGGAGGLAHIGMLGVFDELGVTPHRITGTSIGAVIGALYAAGLSADEIHDIFDDFGGSRLDLLSRLMRPGADLTLRMLISFDFDNGGIIDPRGFLDFLATRIDARSFDDLRIPLEVVATDYWTGESVVLSEGDLFQALKASMAVPGLFSPVVRDQQLLVDGGASNPLPYDLLQDRVDLIVAVDVTGSREPGDRKRADLSELMFKTFEIMQQSIIRARMQLLAPDILVRPQLQDVRLLDFNRVEDILEQSRAAADELKAALQEALKAEEQTVDETVGSAERS